MNTWHVSTMYNSAVYIVASCQQSLPQLATATYGTMHTQPFQARSFQLKGWFICNPTYHISLVCRVKLWCRYLSVLPFYFVSLHSVPKLLYLKNHLECSLTFFFMTICFKLPLTGQRHHLMIMLHCNWHIALMMVSSGIWCGILVAANDLLSTS